MAKRDIVNAQAAAMATAALIAGAIAVAAIAPEIATAAAFWEAAAVVGGRVALVGGKRRELRI